MLTLLPYGNPAMITPGDTAMDKAKNKFKVTYVTPAYSGNEYHLTFDTPPTQEELYQSVRSIDSCPFGFRMVSGRINETNRIVVKIYTD
jgi:hypothetical protein